jgi:RNA polymerase sigma factor (sigma-70 family)
MSEGTTQEDILLRDFILADDKGDMKERNRAFRRLYDLLFPPLCSFLRRLGASERETEDYTQEAFKQLIRWARTVRENVKAWLFRVMARIYFKAARRQRREMPADDSSISAHASMHADDRKRHEDRSVLETVGEVLSRTSPAHQACWIHRRVYEEPLEVIARRLGMSISTVKRKVALIDALLENELDQDIDEAFGKDPEGAPDDRSSKGPRKEPIEGIVVEGVSQ